MSDIALVGLWLRNELQKSYLSGAAPLDAVLKINGHGGIDKNFLWRAVAFPNAPTSVTDKMFTSIQSYNGKDLSAEQSLEVAKEVG